MTMKITPMETEFNKLSISDRDSDVSKNCSHCNKPFTEELWCKKCDPFRIVEGWISSGNSDIDKFIKDTMYKPAEYNKDNKEYNYSFLEWVPFDRFTDIKEVGEGGFAKVYYAIWVDGKSKYRKLNDKDWEKLNFVPKKVA